MQQLLARALWATAFVAVFLAPLLLYVARADDGRWNGEPLADQLCMVLGLVATSALVCAVVLPSRLRSLTRTFGIDGVLGTHRYIGVLAAVMTLAHVALVVAEDPANVALFNLAEAPGRARAATVATAALIGLVVLTVLRRQLGHRYEKWRSVHLALAATAVLGAGLHIWWLEHLVLDPAMQALFGVMAAGVLAVLAHRWVLRRALDTRSEYILREVRPETDSVSTLVLEPCTGQGRPCRSLEFAPGQFAWLRLDQSLRAEEHPFTIASSAYNGLWTEFTVRHSGDFTDELRRLRPGSRVWVDGPHGAFTVDLQRTTGLVLIAGGVGITPMMSMLRTLAHRGDNRPHRLLVVARDHTELLFRDEIHALRRRLHLLVVEVLRNPPPGWTGPTGRVSSRLLTAVLPGPFRRNQLDYFVCGPPGMVSDVLTELEELHIPHPRIHTEQFDFV